MFNFPFFIFSTTTLFLIFASIYDFKKRIIPNYLVFSLFFIGLLIKIIEAIFFSKINILFNSLISFLITFILSYILWELGFFAGGDLKLFSAISILNPFNLNFLSFLGLTSLGVIAVPIFSITLVLVSVLATAPVLIIHSLFLFLFKGHHFILWDILKSKGTIISFLNSVIVLFFITSFLNLFSLNLPIIFYFIFSIVLLLFFKNLEKLKSFYFLIGLFYILLITFSIIYKKNIFSIISLVTIIITIKLLFVFITIYKIISSRILTEPKKLKDLKEGDLLKNNYYKINNKVIEKNISFLNYFKQTFYQTYTKNLIVDSRKARGVLKEDITFLKRTYNNLNKEIIIRKTIPFTPSVLLGYIILNIFGDFIWFLF